MSTASSLAALLRVQADLSYDTSRLSFVSQEYQTAHKQLQEQEKYATKWENAKDAALDPDKTCKIGNRTWKEKDEVLSEARAEEYADAKVKQFDQELYDSLCEKDVEYEALKTLYETEITILQQEEQNLKTQTGTFAQDTHLLQS